MFVALVLLSSWLPSTSYASFPAAQTNPSACTVAPCYIYQTYTPSAYLVATYTTLQAAKDEVSRRLDPDGAFEGGPDSYDYRLSGGYLYTGMIIRRNGGAPVAPVYSCPANATLSGSSCSCNTGFTQSGSTCVDPNVAKCAQAKSGVDLFTGFGSLPNVGSSFCPADGAASSCAAKVSGGFCVVKGGVKKCTHEVTYTGGTCTPPAPSSSEPSPTPTPCKGTYGQVNGVDVCLPLGTDPAATVETAKKTETTTTPSGGGGSTTESTTEQATCIGSMCTTVKTTTTTTPDGVSTSRAETKSESRDDFCKASPRSPQCLTSSWGGSCSANFSCDGDAVMCAISKEQHIRNCKLFEDMSSTEAQLYNNEKGKTGEQTSTLPGSATIHISSSSFDTSDAIGAGSGCIADKSVTVAGSTVTLPLSSVCGHLAMLGNILMAVSFLLAGRIVVRG